MCILMAVTSCTVVAQFVVSIAQCNESRDRYWTIVVHSYNDIMGINHSCQCCDNVCGVSPGVKLVHVPLTGCSRE